VAQARPIPVWVTADFATASASPSTPACSTGALYGNDTLVVFYKTFPSSYSYTRIGRITKTDGLVQALGAGSQRIGFAVE
jgi:Cyclophilin-like family